MDKLTEHFENIISEVGEDVNREGLQKTPARAAASFRFLTRGYTQSIDEILNGAIFKSEISEMVVVKNIELYSLCEHHLLPFIGQCHIGYLPAGKVVGLSKLARVVDLFARRLQIQEELTKQIAEAILEATGAHGVGVIIEAKHLCMMMRGVEKQNSVMVTSMMLGKLRDNASSRLEFLNLARQA